MKFEWESMTNVGLRSTKACALMSAWNTGPDLAVLTCPNLPLTRAEAPKSNADVADCKANEGTEGAHI